MKHLSSCGPDKENKHESELKLRKKKYKIKNPEKEIHTFMERRFCFQSHPALTAFIWFSLAAENQDLSSRSYGINCSSDRRNELTAPGLTQLFCTQHRDQ